KDVEDNYRLLLEQIALLYDNNRESLNGAYWLTGKYIADEEKKSPTPSGYGSSLIDRLSLDLTERYGRGFSRTNLKNMRVFFRYYPNGQPADHFDWTKMVLLLSVKDEDARAELLQRTIDEKLTRQDLVHHINLYRLSANNTAQANEYRITRGDMYCYMSTGIPDEKGRLDVDCGFSVHRTVKFENIAEDEYPLMFRSEKKKGKYYVRERLDESPENSSRFHTYMARVEKVIDGDTLRLAIDTGFETVVKQKIRLRGIDCPEIIFTEGRKARDFARRELDGCDFVVVKTYRTDKYDRYIGDIFYIKNEQSLERICAEGKLLNRELLSKGLARPLQIV
ncbi:MAG: hypothetical protein GXY14_14845, partial [Spirochaetes bacterium]|nr:hypothetical protein [Spirochaetota bacterium]